MDEVVSHEAAPASQAENEPAPAAAAAPAAAPAPDAAAPVDVSDGGGPAAAPSPAATAHDYEGPTTVLATAITKRKPKAAAPGSASEFERLLARNAERRRFEEPPNLVLYADEMRKRRVRTTHINRKALEQTQSALDEARRQLEARRREREAAVAERRRLMGLSNQPREYRPRGSAGRPGAGASGGGDPSASIRATPHGAQQQQQQQRRRPTTAAAASNHQGAAVDAAAGGGSAPAEGGGGPEGGGPATKPRPRSAPLRGGGKPMGGGGGGGGAPTTLVLATRAAAGSSDPRGQHAPAERSNFAKRYWEATTPARNLPQPELPPWNSTPHMGVPWALRGLRLEARRYHEPWMEEAASMEAEGRPLGFTSLHKPARRLREAPAAMYISRSGESADATRAGIATNRKPWDNTPWVSVPAPLRNLNPMTMEPWAKDQQALMALEMRRMDEAGEEQRRAPRNVMKVDMRDMPGVLGSEGRLLLPAPPAGDTTSGGGGS